MLCVLNKSLPLPHHPVLDGNLTNTYNNYGKVFKSVYGRRL